eukprot:355383-Chlamydomonas_euryale.AAC.1
MSLLLRCFRGAREDGSSRSSALETGVNGDVSAGCGCGSFDSFAAPSVPQLCKRGTSQQPHDGRQSVGQATPAALASSLAQVGWKQQQQEQEERERELLRDIDAAAAAEVR